MVAKLTRTIPRTPWNCAVALGFENSVVQVVGVVARFWVFELGPPKSDPTLFPNAVRSE